jgi:hypothetical protein
MNKFFQWIIGISVVVLVLAFAVSMLAPLFVPSLRGATAMPHAWMMGGGGFDGRGGMMGRGFGLPFFGGMFLIPLLFVGGLVLGVMWLMHAVTRPAPQAPAAPAPAPAATCAHCGQPLQAGWKACPYCGEKVQ